MDIVHRMTHDLYPDLQKSKRVQKFLDKHNSAKRNSVLYRNLSDLAGSGYKNYNDFQTYNSHLIQKPSKYIVKQGTQTLKNNIGRFGLHTVGAGVGAVKDLAHYGGGMAKYAFHRLSKTTGLDKHIDSFKTSTTSGIKSTNPNSSTSAIKQGSSNTNSIK